MASRVEKKLLQLLGRASKDFALIEPGDKIMVGVSGGKDSFTLLTLLHTIQSKAPFEFDIIAVNLDQGQPGFHAEVLEDYFKKEGFKYKMVKKDTYSIVTEKIPEGQTYCSLCSRLRRGILYNTAVELGATKIALGHHKDDVIETLMLNMLFAGQIKAMPARLTSDDGRNTVIRPLAYCDEADIIEFAKERSFPILPCDLCGSQENLMRKRVKRLIASLNEENSHIRGNLFSALSSVIPSHLYDKSVIRTEATV